MKPEERRLRFFLGANTPQGFVSRFEQLTSEGDGWRVHIIKGGPGTGKSSMIKKIAEAFYDECPGMEIIHCSSDADSLDGVIIPEKKFTLVDGTAPHVMEPKYPGAVESLVDVTSCWDADMLYNCREQIISLCASCTKCHEYACRFLGAAGALMGDSYRIALDCVDSVKLNGYLGRLSEKELRPRADGQGRERVRFMTAVTNRGVVKYSDSAKLLAKRIYLINDEYGAVSRLMLHYIRSKALAAGYDIVSCYCPLAPFDKLEQLFIPALSLGFMTSNRFHSFEMEIDPYRIINCQRFTLGQKLKEKKRRLTFNRKAAAQMIGQAEALMREAKALHDETESYYIAATDFKKADKLGEKLLEELRAQG